MLRLCKCCASPHPCKHCQPCDFEQHIERPTFDTRNLCCLHRDPSEWPPKRLGIGKCTIEYQVEEHPDRHTEQAPSTRRSASPHGHHCCKCNDTRSHRMKHPDSARWYVDDVRQQRTTHQCSVVELFVTKHEPHCNDCSAEKPKEHEALIV